MIACPQREATGLLLSGGLDSAVLFGHLLGRGCRVQPIYVRAGFVWEDEEMQAARRFLAAMEHREPADTSFEPLVALEMPVTDLYADHWSVTGTETPGYRSPDEAVYLPGHNVLLLVKAALWCRVRGIGSLALASLSTNPFADATKVFFDLFEAALCEATGGEVRFVRPFAHLDKDQVMQLGCALPLQHTFSCLAPVGGLHCGRCNKCAERQTAFRCLPMSDPTRYAKMVDIG